MSSHSEHLVCPDVSSRLPKQHIKERCLTSLSLHFALVTTLSGERPDTKALLPQVSEASNENTATVADFALLWSGWQWHCIQGAVFILSLCGASTYNSQFYATAAVTDDGFCV